MPDRLYVCTSVNADAVGVAPCGIGIELLLILPL
jgi:hypothetical protein